MQDGAEISRAEQWRGGDDHDCGEVACGSRLISGDRKRRVAATTTTVIRADNLCAGAGSRVDRRLGGSATRGKALEEAARRYWRRRRPSTPDSGTQSGHRAGKSTACRNGLGEGHERHPQRAGPQAREEREVRQSRRRNPRRNETGKRNPRSTQPENSQPLRSREPPPRAAPAAAVESVSSRREWPPSRPPKSALRDSSPARDPGWRTSCERTRPRSM